MLEYNALREQLRARESMPVSKAKSLLMDDTTPATLLYLAARAFYGPTVAAYEPDSLWVQLDVPSVNRDKLMAALTLQTRPSFYWDMRVFGHTCLAFNDQAAHTELLPQPCPEHLTWAVFEAQLIFQLDSDTTPEFDEEVEAYVAACLAHAGLTYAPPLLDFAETHLERILSPEGRKLGAAMKKIAGEPHPKVDRKSALGVQLAQYEQIGDYVTARMTALSARVTP